MRNCHNGIINRRPMSMRSLALRSLAFGSLRSFRGGLLSMPPPSCSLPLGMLPPLTNIPQERIAKLASISLSLSLSLQYPFPFLFPFPAANLLRLSTKCSCLTSRFAQQSVVGLFLFSDKEEFWKLPLCAQTARVLLFFYFFNELCGQVNISLVSFAMASVVVPPVLPKDN